MLARLRACRSRARSCANPRRQGRASPPVECGCRLPGRGSRTRSTRRRQGPLASPQPQRDRCPRGEARLADRRAVSWGERARPRDTHRRAGTEDRAGTRGCRRDRAARPASHRAVVAPAGSPSSSRRSPRRGSRFASWESETFTSRASTTRQDCRRSAQTVRPLVSISHALRSEGSWLAMDRARIASVRTMSRSSIREYREVTR